MSDTTATPSPGASSGLRGQSAGETALCTVGQTGSGLRYRGYDLEDLAAHASFEEVAYLLLKGKLPNREELDAYIARLKGLSVHTVQTHIKNLYGKLAVHSKSEAVFEATRLGLLSRSG